VYVKSDTILLFLAIELLWRLSAIVAVVANFIVVFFANFIVVILLALCNLRNTYNSISQNVSFGK
jgi:uncharacterized membrane protein YhaH (DUF805 family)